MPHRRSRLAAVAVAIAATMSSAPTVPPVPTGVELLATEAWGMGGSGTPLPSPGLIADVLARYNPRVPLFAGQPLYQVDSTHPLFTPEGLYPMTGVKSLTLDASLAQGVQMLHATITDRLAAGSDLVVVGGSQSSTLSSLEMRNLLALPADQQPTADQLSFLLLVDPSNPNGGLLSRFGDPSLPPLSLPSLGVTFSGATPADTPWHTAIYNLEYDGFSDFPRYPLNLLADLNAVLGIAFVHATVADLSEAQLAATVELPVSEDYTGHTRYFMIPTENLPLLEIARMIPGLGNPLADLVQPALRVLVNLGYGNIEHGWDPGPANLSTPFALFPTVDPAEVLGALAVAVQQGIADFHRDLTAPSAVLSALAPGAALPTMTDAINGFTHAIAATYAQLLPLADIATAALTTIPAYAAGLFAQELGSGDLLDAFGLPIAATMGLGSVAAGFGLVSVGHILQAAGEVFGASL